MYLKNAKTSQYAWTLAHINNTDSVRSLVAIGCCFQFPLDVKISPTPVLNTETNSALFQYIRNVSTDSNFSLSILQIVIEERCSYHRDHQNKTKLECSLKVGYVVKSHIQVQSRAESGSVGKVCCRARGSIISTKDLRNGSFENKRYGAADSAYRKYKNTKCYLLPPTLFPSKARFR